MKFVKRLRFIFPALAVAIVIFIASHQAIIKLPDLGFTWEDKVFHMFGYLVFGVTLMLAVRKNFPDMKISKVILIVLALGSLYGISDEFHQSLIPGRTADVFDWIADCCGIGLSILVSFKFV